MMCGLPGGSPGRHASASWGTLFLAFLLSAVVGGALCWILVNVDRYL